MPEKRAFLLLLFILTLAILHQGMPAAAESGNPEWDAVRMRGLPGGKYGISSGTGFFVGGGYIVTNAHVVRNCLTISIRGAVPPSPATLEAIDNAHDLALLRSTVMPARAAYLRANSGVRPGDPVFVIGYPLSHAQTGHYLLNQASIIGFDGDFDQSEKIEITDVVEHGNSGGPLIDGGGNVIGVIVAKASYYQSVAGGAPGNSTPTRTTGIAIGLSLLKQFLSAHNAYYNANTTYDIFTQYRADKRARDYIVNIHCVQR